MEFILILHQTNNKQQNSYILNCVNNYDNYLLQFRYTD